MRRIISIMLLIGIFLMPSAAKADFSDVPNGSEYFIPIMALAEQNLISVKHNAVRASEILTRAQALKLILDILEISVAAQEEIIEKPFEDVGKKRWFSPYVYMAKKLSIIRGREGKFYPDDQVTLAEGLTIILGAYLVTHDGVATLDPAASDLKQKDLADDVKKDDWFHTAFLFGLTKGIVTKTTKNMANPGKFLTRGKLLDMLYRTMRLGDQIQFGRASYYSDYFEGRGTASGEKFTNGGFTAAHRTMKFGTRLLVRNLKNGHTVEVFVNDRGPYSPGLTIDLSQTAFERLDTLSSGVIPIEYKILQ